MRTTLTMLCIIALGYAANSQRFSLLPQVGFENSKTGIRYNDLRSFSPNGIKFSPHASLRLNYSSKQGHGFFVGVASSRSLVSFSFSDPETGMNNFTATTGNMQLRLEGGYQLNSKPISLGKSKQAAAKQESSSNEAKKSCGSYSSRSSCTKGNRSSSHCSGKANKNTTTTSWVRLQPSVGLGFIPGIKSDVITKTQGGQTVYQYNAGNWNTALMAGAGFEFGKGKTRQFTVSVNYLKGLGNLSDQTITSTSGVKSITTTLSSAVSAWNLKVGIPFTLGSSNTAKHKTEKKKAEKKYSCGQYRIIYRCTKSN
ncbi:MAG TPA: hypothetical protein VI461_12840 [Chitinophagaceae bacterium]|nr:hypothetical protein [Chitinophagaceae bacterium]